MTSVNAGVHTHQMPGRGGSPNKLNPLTRGIGPDLRDHGLKSTLLSMEKKPVEEVDRQELQSNWHHCSWRVWGVFVSSLNFPREVLQYECFWLEEMQAVLTCWASCGVQEVGRGKEKKGEGGRGGRERRNERREIKNCGKKEGIYLLLFIKKLHMSPVLKYRKWDY